MARVQGLRAVSFALMLSWGNWGGAMGAIAQSSPPQDLVNEMLPAQSTDAAPPPNPDAAASPDRDPTLDPNANPSGRPPSDPNAIPPGRSTLNTPRFTCQWVDGQPTVFYSPQSQPDRFYPWAVPQAMGGGWSPERRCQEIARRLESYRPQGLVDMTTSVENGYDIVCVTTEQVPGCQIVFTVPPGQDPLATRDRVFANLALADTEQTTQGVYTFAGSGRGWLTEIVDLVGGPSPRDRRWSGRSRPTSGPLYLRPFLDPADGGTGDYLAP
jgi:hypothetical protein